MKLPHHLTIKNGHLQLNGLDCVALAQQYGTPLYVTSEDRVCEQFRSYQKALSSRYPKVRVLFAAKANGNLAVIRALAELGAGADVFSSGELHLALDAGMQPEKLLFNGSSKA
jgi:diaminopimelate decarboxylase